MWANSAIYKTSEYRIDFQQPSNVIFKVVVEARGLIQAIKQLICVIITYQRPL